MRFLFPFLVLFLMTCSDTPTDLCENTLCIQGICNPQNGECGNPDSCENSTTCLDGFLCEENSCVGQIPCSEETPCERGQCFSGTCINFDICEKKSDCLRNYACEDSLCAFDRCADSECEQGVCEKESGKCVNDEVCTQNDNCIEGYYCYGQKCEDQGAICADLSCTRGICDASQSACINKDNCENDIDCLKNSFCDAGACIENQCVDGMCARGLCEGKTGTCINPDRCDNSESCVDGFLCVQNQCLSIEKACGETGCPGNMKCIHNEDNLSATCDENAKCRRGEDCLDNRVCDEGVCAFPKTCENDDLEPNNNKSEASRIEKQSDNFRRAKLCQGDQDFFIYDIQDSPIFSGTLVISVHIDPVNIGNGNLELRVSAPSGEMKSAVTDLDSSSARVSFDIGALNRGEYSIEVVDTNVELGGVAYQIFAKIVENGLAESCSMPTPLVHDIPVNADSTSGKSFGLGSTCTQPKNSATENIFSFNLDKSSHVSIDVVPDGASDLSISLRTSCENDIEDIECVDAQKEGETEKLNRRLDPGQYFVIVQASEANLGGGYEITFRAEPTICVFGEATCMDQNTSRFCSATQTGFETKTCVDGCNNENGFCNAEPGDTCLVAEDATQGYTGTVVFASLTHDYEVAVGGSCVPTEAGSTSTDGPDGTYLVKLQPQQLVTATLVTENFGEDAALYIVSDCTNIENTCLAGSNTRFSKTESISYKNDGSSEMILYIIADIEDRTTHGPANIDIQIEDVICSPRETRCVANLSEQCSKKGTEFNSSLCSADCEMATGKCNSVPNNQCTGAISLTSPTTIQGRIDEFTANYLVPAECTSRQGRGNDATYSFMSGPAGQVARIQVDAQFNTVLYVTKDCDALETHCVATPRNSNAKTDHVEFVVEANTTYYVVVDSMSSRDQGEFTLTYELLDPTCTPGNRLGCSGNNLRYCTQLGLPDFHTCSSTCSNNGCDTPDGDTCFEAIPATTGVYSGNFNGTNSVDITKTSQGQCSFGNNEPEGRDTIYAVSMKAGESLFVKLDSANSQALLYFLSDCDTGSTCLKNSRGNHASLHYSASQDETIFVVVDRSSRFPTSTTFQLSIRVGAPDCSPGAPRLCNAAQDAIEYCDAFGFSQTHQCTGSCTSGHCDNPKGNVCVDPIILNAGQSHSSTFSTNDSQFNIDGPKQGHCRLQSNSVSVGNDTVYQVDLLAGQLLEAKLDTINNSAYVYILEHCEDLSTCSDINTNRGKGSAYHLADVDERVFIVVDSTSSFSSASYIISALVSDGKACVPNKALCDSTNTVGICNLNGTGLTTGFSCPNGCNEGSCVPKSESDLCSTAPLTDGIHIYDSFSNYTNDRNPGFNCTGTSTSGPDLTFKYQVTAGDVFHARLQSFGRESLSLYLLSDCSNPSMSCEGVRGNTDRVAELYYLATQNETLILVADSNNSANDEFSLYMESIPPECTPGALPTCDGNALKFCNDFGLFENFACDGTCNNGVCQNPSGKTCFDPVVISSSIQLTAQRFEGENEIQTEGQQGACNTTSTTRGFEKIYRLDLQANDTILANYDSQSSSTEMYILGDCSDVNSCIKTTQQSSRRGTLKYTATQNESIFLVVDRTASSSTTLTFNLDIQFRKPCVVGIAPTCIDGNTLKGCASDGLTIESNCNAGCMNDKCGVPNGQFCSEAIPLTHGQSDSRNFGNPNSIEAEGTLGACTFAAKTDGSDYIYSVTLSAGDILTANYNSRHDSTELYLTQDCSDLNQCQAHVTGRNGSLTYTAMQNETVFLIMDRVDSANKSSYTLSVSVLVPNCAWGDPATCVDANTISVCADLQQQSFPCACANAKCTAPTGMNCPDAKSVTLGAVIHDTFDGTNALSLESSQGSCTFNNPTKGTDHFYKVPMLSGQTLSASFSSTSSLAVLYIMTSCLDKNSCQSNTPMSGSGSLSYTATQDETVFVVMDRTSAGASPGFNYDLTINVN